jgi:protein-S-isoprenylcysteine O-methyltransferase Ste14
MTHRVTKMTTLAPPATDIATVQKLRKLGLLVMLASLAVLFVFGTSRWPSPAEDAIEWVGMVLIFVCVCGRTWCSLYIGGRKISELVTAGPYSISRNPLYLFSVIGAVGVGAQLGSVAVAALAGIFVWAVHLLVVVQEERLLSFEHGDAYRTYLAAVPRFLPRFALWKDLDMLHVSPRVVNRTFLDACMFLAAIPVAEMFDYLHDSGLLRVIFRLP